MAGGDVSIGATGGAQDSADSYLLLSADPSSRFLSDNPVSILPSNREGRFPYPEIFGRKDDYTKAIRAGLGRARAEENGLVGLR